MKPAKALFLLAIIFFITALHLHAQTIEERLLQKRPSCREILSNASSLLPELYEESAFDSIEKAIALVQKSCTDIQEVFYLSILLAIQQSTFSVRENIDSSFIEKLNSYGSAAALPKRRNAQIYIADDYKLIPFIKQWAADLLKRSRLSGDERFLCTVLAGHIYNPENELKLHKDECPELYALLKQSYINERNGARFTKAIIIGIWLPTKDLKVLGPHPSLGWSLGGGGRNDELDITFQFRFLNSKNSYEILRQNTLYPMHNYFGGYIGIDYTRYFIHQTSYEFGLLGGAGFDGFDITSYNHHNDYLRPFSINSFNRNIGLRFNYFFNPHSFIGLQTRYNFINYSNKGGTSLHGDAFSIDLLIGDSKTYN